LGRIVGDILAEGLVICEITQLNTPNIEVELINEIEARTVSPGLISKLGIVIEKSGKISYHA